MQLRFTKGVGIAMAIAAGCAVLGFVMAPGWWFFAAFSAWSAFVVSAGGSFISTRGLNSGDDDQARYELIDDTMDPSLRKTTAGNVYRYNSLLD